MSTYIPILWPPHVKSWLIGKDSDAGRDLGAGGEGDNRRWDGWMASLTQWTWVWVNSKKWWWTRRPGVLQFMGSQRVGHDWVTELNWTELNELLAHNLTIFPTESSFPKSSHNQTYLQSKLLESGSIIQLSITKYKFQTLILF